MTAAGRKVLVSMGCLSGEKLDKVYRAFAPAELINIVSPACAGMTEEIKIVTNVRRLPRQLARPRYCC